ncbi:hypothetical protein FQA47_012910 [Oryzias melastigma]|uniref:Uncharacterized protein n=1 Tax=Oryzias melastigma TaxID=30732 RepID=A0A834CJ15_ORYME|nr:hypothetical protein FQA47_012910 [Oryzias melastigma]
MENGRVLWKLMGSLALTHLRTTKLHNESFLTMKELNSNTTLTQTAQSKDTVVSLEEIYIVSDIQRSSSESESLWSGEHRQKVYVCVGLNIRTVSPQLDALTENSGDGQLLGRKLLSDKTSHQAPSQHPCPFILRGQCAPASAALLPSA